MHRRFFCISLAAAFTTTTANLALLAGSAAQAADNDQRVPAGGSVADIVRDRARALAALPYQDSSGFLSDGLRALDYDDYRRIVYRDNKGFWRDQPFGFELQPLHRGFIQTGRMALNLVIDRIVYPLAYDANLFRFDGEAPPAVSNGDIGYSGYRLMAQVGPGRIAREFLVFQGASYFRVIPPGMVYGLSARGIALRTGEPDGEEFPSFVEAWIERPQPGAGEIILHALLDGPSVTGAYRFVVRPDMDGSAADSAKTVIDVTATLFPRVDLVNVGLAPLTSMYWFSPLEKKTVDDYRSRVHDSDGLQIEMDTGESVWRPLANPEHLQASSFLAGPSGVVSSFGLAQRDRNWSSYQDAEANYHHRPGCRVEPGDGWPRGRVELIEIPTANEYADNIVAYWRPEEPLRAGSEITFDYTLHWSGGITGGADLLRVAGSASGRAPGPDDKREIVIDFAQSSRVPMIGKAAPADLVPVVEVVDGRVDGISLRRVPDTGGMRLSFFVTMDAPAVELRVILQRQDCAASETWLYRMKRS